MKIRFRFFILMSAAFLFIAALGASNGMWAQEMPGMPGMKMLQPKAKKPASKKSQSKTKPALKRQTSAKTKRKATRKTTKAKPTEMSMPVNTPIPSSPNSEPTQTLMQMEMPVPKSSPSPPSPMQMEMPTNMPSPLPTVTPSPSPSPTSMPMEMNMPMPAPAPTPAATATPSLMPRQTEMNMPGMQMPGMQMPTPAPTPPPNTSQTGGGQTQTLPNLSKKFPPPVADNERYGSTLFDILEFRPGRGGNSDFRWDIESWYGTDYNRFFIKSEGERNTAFKADYDIDLQLLYSRLISPYFNFQTGVRFETQTFRGANVTRPQAVVGFEGLAPYFIELESAAFVDPKGNVSGRLSLTKDFLFTNRLIMQARFETNMAIQRVERFTTGRGLNNIEAGFRFRYEFRRRFAPYVGVSFDRSFFETADLVRQDGGDPKQVRLVTGVRMFF